MLKKKQLFIAGQQKNKKTIRSKISRPSLIVNRFNPLFSVSYNNSTLLCQLFKVKQMSLKVCEIQYRTVLT